MHLSKVGGSMGSLALTPERVPAFLIPSAASCRSPLLSRSPRTGDSPERMRLLSRGSSDASPRREPSSPQRVSRHVLRVPTPSPAAGPPRRRRPVPADVDSSTRAAMSLPHVEKITTPYGFRAVLAESPCTRRRESLFHGSTVPLVTVSEHRCTGMSSPVTQSPGAVRPAVAPKTPGGKTLWLRPVKALGLQMLRELRSLSPGRRRAENI